MDTKNRSETNIYEAGHIEESFYQAGAISSKKDRTLQKRIAKIINSRLFVLLALLSAASAIFTFFRGYPLPVTLLLALFRSSFTIIVWSIFYSEGRKGLKQLAAFAFAQRIAFIFFFLFFAVFCVVAMFGFCITGNLFLGFAWKIKNLGIAALIPVIGLFALAYISNLYLSRKALLFANIRDDFLYGFTFEKGSAGYIKDSLILAVVYPALFIFGSALGSFSKIGFISDAFSGFLDKYLLGNLNFFISLIGICLTSATLILAASVAKSFSAAIKRYKADKAATKAGFDRVMAKEKSN